VHNRVARGLLIPLSTRVLRVAGTPETTLSMVMAGVLDSGPGAVLSHRSAAWFWGAPGYEPTPIEATGRRRRVAPADVRLASVHVPRRLLAAHWVEVDGLSVTTPTRTVFDLAGLRDVHPKRVERTLDTFWAKGRVSRASLETMLADLARRGRAGIGLMRELIASRSEHYRPPESGAESRFQQLATEAGLADFVRQQDVGDEERWIGRVDFLDPDRKLVVEVDPALHHGSLSDQRHDADRHDALRAAGWLVESFTDVELFHRPDEVRCRLAALRIGFPRVLVD
jgi:very-short-patch-repair endonuclease